MSFQHHPYIQFNFLLDLGTETGPQAGFQECSSVGDLTDPNESSAITFKRGLIDANHLQEWLDQIRTKDPRAYRSVLVRLQGERHTVVQKWTLTRSIISRHVGGALQVGEDVVTIEELVLTYEQMKLD